MISRWYPLGVLRPASSLVLFLIVLFVSLGGAAPSHAERPAKFEPYPPLEEGSVVADIDGRRLTIDYSRTIGGPLFALQPLVEQLGGNLRVGPLQQSHELEVTGTTFLFGPGSGALTNGEDIQNLSQPPGVGPQGLLVPLDLLRTIYTRLMGFDFSWYPDELVLLVSRQPL